MNQVVICVPMLICDPEQVTSMSQEDLSRMVAKHADQHLPTVNLNEGHALEQPSTQAEQVKSKLSSLAPREIEVLMHIADGDSYKVIAKKLGLSPHTVAGYKKEIYRKLGINTAAQAVKVALTYFTG